MIKTTSRKQKSVDKNGKVRIKPAFLSQPSSATYFDNWNNIKHDDGSTISAALQEKEQKSKDSEASVIS